MTTATQPVVRTVDNPTTVAVLAATLLYLLLSLPLGVAAFALVVSGLALGVGLAITLLGIPILLGTALAARALLDLDRRLANALLDAGIPAAAAPEVGTGGVLQRLTAAARSRGTVAPVLYLALVRLPAGVAAFTLAVVTVVVPLAYVLAPWSYPHASLFLWSGRVDTPAEAWIAVPVGMLLAAVAVALIHAARRVAVKLTAAAVASSAQPPRAP